MSYNPWDDVKNAWESASEGASNAWDNAGGWGQNFVDVFRDPFTGAAAGAASMGGSGALLGGWAGSQGAAYQRQKEEADKLRNMVKPPTYEGYNKVLRDDMSLPGQYQVGGLSGLPMEQLRGQAAGGESNWAKMMRDKQKERYDGAAADLGKQSASASMGMQKAISRTGGLSSGAAGRVDDQASRNRMFAMQGLGATREAGNLEIDNIEEAQRQATLQQLPSLELQALKPQEFNIQTTLAEKMREEEAAMQRYGQEMANFGRLQTTNAMTQASQPTGLLGALHF